MIDDSDDADVIGTNEWWRSATSGMLATEIRGPVDCALRLLECEEISRAKTREIINDWAGALPCCPAAPWDKVNFSDAEVRASGYILDEMKTAGHVLAMRLLQSDVVIDDTERAAIEFFCST